MYEPSGNITRGRFDDVELEADEFDDEDSDSVEAKAILFLLLVIAFNSITDIITTNRFGCNARIRIRTIAISS